MRRRGSSNYSRLRSLAHSTVSRYLRERRDRIHRYAASGDGTSSDSSSCNWVTIGSQPGGPGEGNKGGVPVCIGSNGKIEKGPKNLTGRSMKRLTGGDPKANGRRVTREAAKAHGLDLDELNAAIDDELAIRQQQSRDHEAVKKRAREISGLNERDVQRIENGHRDHSTVAKFDTVARSLLTEFPELGWEPDDPGNAAKLWALLREGKGRIPQRYDEGLIRDVAERLGGERGGATGGGPGDDPPPDHAYDPDWDSPPSPSPKPKKNPAASSRRRKMTIQQAQHALAERGYTLEDAAFDLDAQQTVYQIRKPDGGELNIGAHKLQDMIEGWKGEPEASDDFGGRVAGVPFSRLARLMDRMIYEKRAERWATRHRATA